MTINRAHGTWVIAFSFIVAFTLTALPLPDWAELWRPAWTAMVLIYWCMALPQRVGVVVAWIVGLGLDVLQGSLLGQHALALAIVAFMTHKLHRQVRVLAPWQQGVAIFALIIIYQGFIIWVTSMQGLMVHGSVAWTTPVMSMLLWPWIFVLMRDLRRRYHVT